MQIQFKKAQRGRDHLTQSPKEIARSVLLSLVLFTISLILGSGCPGGEPAVELDKECQTVGDLCRIRDGVLGVCSPTESGSSIRSTLICTPQH